MTRPARPAARPGRRVLAGTLAAGLLAACAALTLAASPARARPPAAAVASFTTPVLLAAHPSSRLPRPPAPARPPRLPQPAAAAAGSWMSAARSGTRSPPGSRPWPATRSGRC